MFSAPVKGNIGELTVAGCLKKLPTNNYTVFNDVMIKTKSGSIQIDHIVVSKYGIFVIETKNMLGWINGSDTSEYWTKTHNGHRYEFFNPIKQNTAHINALKQKLNLPTNKFISIIVFSMRGHLNLSNVSVPVLYTPHIVAKIMCYRNIRLSTECVNTAIHQIQKLKKYKSVSNFEHIQDVKRSIANKNKKIAAHICPVCSKRLISRYGKYGWFLSCSGYPKCKYIHKDNRK